MKLSASHLLLELQVDGLNAAVISCSISVCVTLRKFQCSITWKLFDAMALDSDVVAI
jgi:hypothetical protein